VQGRLCSFGKRAFLELSLVIETAVDLFSGASFWMIMACTFGGMYVFIMLYVAYLLHVNAWLTIAPPLVPITVAWYWILRRRVKSYLGLLLQTPKSWDIDEAIEGYAELLEEQRKEKQLRKH